MVDLPFGRLPASLWGLVGRHCPDNAVDKLALCTQRPFGCRGCGRIVSVQSGAGNGSPMPRPETEHRLHGEGPPNVRQRWGNWSMGPSPGHVPPRLVTDVERLYVTRRVELIGSFRQTERGPGETPAPTRPRA